MSETTYPPRRDCLLVPGVLDGLARPVRDDPARAPALARLLADAGASLRARPPSVLDKAHVPPTGDKRDYFSLSIYYWPDPAKPDGLPYVPRDGLVNPETRDYDGESFATMYRHVDTLALAYAAAGDERYAEKAAAFLRTWFVDDRTAMRPNMLFAQYIPGDAVTTPWKDYPARFVPGTGGRKGVYVSFGGTIEDLILVPLTDCVRALRPSPHWTSADDEALRAWYAAYTEWLLTHQHGLDEAGCRNNHGSWYWAGIACFQEFVGRPDEVLRRIPQVLHQRLRLQIEPDGSQPEELVRAISQTYVSFTLVSLANIAITSGRCGHDAWAEETPDGRSIRKAIDWLIPYLTGEETWTWRQIKPYDPASMIGPLAACAARYPDAGYDNLIRRIPAWPADHRYRLFVGSNEARRGRAN